MIKNLLISGIYILTVNICMAQTAINVAGGDVKNSTATVSWSIGQTFYQSSESNLTEGVQQPYEIFNIGINDTEAISLNLVVYPNPTPDFLELKIEDKNFDFKTGSYQITDINGRVIISEKISDFHTQISMIKFMQGIYLLEISVERNTVKTFKIIKN